MRALGCPKRYRCFSRCHGGSRDGLPRPQRRFQIVSLCTANRAVHDLRGPKSEHDHQASLLAPGYLKGLDQGHWQQENDDVLGDVHSGVCEPDDLAVHTAHTLHGLFPECFNRSAHEDVAENGPDSIHNHNQENAVAHFLKAAHWEDPQVLNQDRDLCEGECETVYPESCPKSLACVLARRTLTKTESAVQESLRSGWWLQSMMERL